MLCRAAWWALLWVAANAAMLMFTMSDLIGRPVPEVGFASVSSLALSVPQGRAMLVQAGLAAALWVGGILGWRHRVRTLPALAEGRAGAFRRLAGGELIAFAVAVGIAVALSRTPTPEPAGPAGFDPVTELPGFPAPPPLTAAALVRPPLWDPRRRTRTTPPRPGRRPGALDQQRHVRSHPALRDLGLPDPPWHARESMIRERLPVTVHVVGVVRRREWSSARRRHRRSPDHGLVPRPGCRPPARSGFEERM